MSLNTTSTNNTNNFLIDPNSELTVNTFNNIFMINKIFGNNEDLLLLGQLESSYITNFPNAKNINDKNFEDVYVVYTLFINNKYIQLINLDSKTPDDIKFYIFNTPIIKHRAKNDNIKQFIKKLDYKATLYFELFQGNTSIHFGSVNNLVFDLSRIFLQNLQNDLNAQSTNKLHLTFGKQNKLLRSNRVHPNENKVIYLNDSNNGYIDIQFKNEFINMYNIEIFYISPYIDVTDFNGNYFKKNMNILKSNTNTQSEYSRSNHIFLDHEVFINKKINIPSTNQNINMGYFYSRMYFKKSLLQNEIVETKLTNKLLCNGLGGILITYTDVSGIQEYYKYYDFLHNDLDTPSFLVQIYKGEIIV